MKILKTVFASLLLTGAVLTSCTKDEVTPNLLVNSDNSNMEIRVIEYDSANGPSKILAFKDTNAYNRTMKELETLMNEEATKKGGDIYKPLLDFAKQYNFQPILADYITYEKEWLTHKELDFSKLPNDMFKGIDAIGLAVRNNKYEVMIGNQIIINGDNASAIIIKDANLETLKSIEKYDNINHIDNKFADNIIVMTPIDKMMTEILIRGRQDAYYNNGYKCLVCINGQYYYNGANRRIYAKSYNWQWYNNKWNASNAGTLDVTIYGQYSNGFSGAVAYYSANNVWYIYKHKDSYYPNFITLQKSRHRVVGILTQYVY